MAIGTSGIRGGTARQDVSGAVTAVLVRHVRARVGEAGLHRMLTSTRELRPTVALEDVTGWSTYEEAITLFNAAAVFTVDRHIGLHVGEEMLRPYDGTDIANRLRSLGSPTALLQDIATAMAKFETVSLLEPLEVGGAHAVVRAQTRPGFRCHTHLCEFIRGVLSQVPVLFGLVPAQVTESECQVSGGRFCLYSMSWEAGQWGAFVDERTSLFSAAWSDESVVEAPAELAMDDHTRIAQLTAQLAEMGERLEGVFSTATELLADEDISTLLDRITTRAAHAVSAPRHLLVVRTSPGAPLELHHKGFNSEEASALADELWTDRPDDAGGSRLIVDIASSRRHYGRLAAVFPTGFSFFESERRILHLYANYAATALDVVTALEEARASDTTARALLNLSRALSKGTSTDEVAQLLVDTVPLAVSCDDATVMLWDAEHRRLVVRAQTSGTRPPPAGAGRPDRPDDRAPGDDGVDVGASGASGAGSAGSEEPDSIVIGPSDTPMVSALMNSRKIFAVDQATADPFLSAVLRETGTSASIIAPMFAGEDFIGVVCANFTHDVDPAEYHRSDVHERLAGLADQAVISFQNTALLEQISFMAWHDALTGLPNRRLLQDRVDQELVRGQRVGESMCVFLIDLDRFKSVNDTLGHAAGDELIRQVADRLVATVRRQDTVARLGGDEFAVLLPGLSDPESIENMARRAIGTLNAPFTIDGHDVCTSASIGIAVTPAHGETYDDLLGKADRAMYRSKSTGRNTFHVFTDDIGHPPFDRVVPSGDGPKTGARLS